MKMLPNYSVYSVPVYFFLAMAPHPYSVYLITSTSKQKWSILNHRAQLSDPKVKQSVPAAVYAKFERCRAAHDSKSKLPKFRWQWSNA